MNILSDDNERTDDNCKDESDISYKLCRFLLGWRSSSMLLSSCCCCCCGLEIMVLFLFNMIGDSDTAVIPSFPPLLFLIGLLSIESLLLNRLLSIFLCRFWIFLSVPRPSKHQSCRRKCSKIGREPSTFLFLVFFISSNTVYLDN